MREPIALQTSGSAVPVQAYPADTHGLYVYRATNGGDWTLTYGVSVPLGSFNVNQHAYNAANSINHLTNWHGSPQRVHADLTAAIYELHDLIHDNGGRLLFRPTR
ncbi:hypothetical protein [Streptomyces decoyicus]|uniref:hypothetical protein n=1 Tax=Streptomyces decoyicus TaxID=249567 RepID=UPI002F90BE30